MKFSLVYFNIICDRCLLQYFFVFMWIVFIFYIIDENWKNLFYYYLIEIWKVYVFFVINDFWLWVIIFQGNGSLGEQVVVHFVAHCEPIVALSFDPSGLLLLTVDKCGYRFHLFRIQPHPSGPSLSEVHHLYTLYRYI